MPYITKQERELLNPKIDEVFKFCEQKRGRINYCCTRLVHLWCIKEMEKIKSLVKKYDIVNDAHGILTCVADEFYNAVVVPYEKIKRKLNGAVSQLDAYPDGKIPKLYKCIPCGYEFDKPANFECDGIIISLCCPNCNSLSYGRNNNAESE